MSPDPNGTVKLLSDFHGTTWGDYDAKLMEGSDNVMAGAKKCIVVDYPACDER